MAKAPEYFAETVNEVNQQVWLCQKESSHELGVSFYTTNRSGNSKMVPSKPARRQFEAFCNWITARGKLNLPENMGTDIR